MTRNHSPLRLTPQKDVLYGKTYLNLLGVKPFENASAKFALDSELSAKFRDIAV